MKIHVMSLCSSCAREAYKTVRNIVGIEIVGWTAKVEKNKIVSYKANVKMAFIAERP